MLRRFVVLALIILAAATLLPAADRGETVKIMTQNVDAGTDHSYIVAAALGLLQPPITVGEAVDLTFAAIQASQLERRAGLLAAKIAQEKPDLIALEEVTRWQASLASGAVVYDQLELLLAALKQHGFPCDVVAVNAVNDLTLPGSQILSLREVERDVLLVRADARPPELHFSDVHSHLYANSFPFAGFNVAAGWISASVHTGNRHFVLAMTHLQSNVPGVSQATDVQLAQANELLRSLRHAVVPVVICGDFNSDANDNPKVPDFSPTADLIQKAGYADAWRALHGNDPGNTWPLYLEDQFPVAFPPSAPVERIDLVFSRAMDVTAAERVIAPAPSTAVPPLASDHAGLLVTVKPLAVGAASVR